MRKNTSSESMRTLGITGACVLASVVVVLTIFSYLLFASAHFEWSGYFRAMLRVWPYFVGFLWPAGIAFAYFRRRLKCLPPVHGLAFNARLLAVTSVMFFVHSSYRVYAIVRARAELLDMAEQDQKNRGFRVGIDNSKQKVADETNIHRLEEIISEHGWPERTIFGVKASAGAFLVLQHSDPTYQKKYLPMARAAAVNGEMSLSSLALLEDRVAVSSDRKQLYGSQLTRNVSGEWEPQPIEDEQHVSERRAAVGLEPLSDYLQDFARRNGGGVSSKWGRSAVDERRN